MELSFITNKDRGETIEVYGRAGKFVGELYQGRSGAYYFWVKVDRYAFSPEELGAISNKINELDNEWLFFVNSHLDQAREDYSPDYSRMDVIGQNGNDGLHYEEVAYG